MNKELYQKDNNDYNKCLKAEQLKRKKIIDQATLSFYNLEEANSSKKKLK